MIRKIEIERFSLTSSKPFDQVVQAVNAGIGHPNMAEFARSTHAARSFAELKSAVEKGLSKAGLMLFMQLDQGAVMRKETGHETPKMIRFVRSFKEEDPMNADVLTTRAADGIAVIALGSAKRIYFDAEMGDALTEALDGFAGDLNLRVVIVTGGAPGYFNRHFDIPALIQMAESLRASGRQWPENATYNGGFFDKAMALCESMPKPVIAAISGTALAGAFEFALSCDLRIAEDGEYLIGLPEADLGLLPGAGGT